MLRKITLNRFKKFKNHTVELRPFSVLTGENSSGKTTILQAIHLGLHTLSSSDLLYEKNDKLQIKAKGVGATEFPAIPIEDFRELYYEKTSRQAKTSNMEGIGAFVNLEDDKKNVYKLQISSLFGGFNVRCVSSEEDIANKPEIYQYKSLFILGGHGISRQEMRYFPAKLNQKIASGSQGEILRNQVLELRQNHGNAYKALAECLAKEFGFYLDKISFVEEDDEYVQATYSDCYGGSQLNFDYNCCGNGYLQILQILVPIYCLCPDKCRIVLIDQPEAYLHVGLQKRLIRTLKRLQKELNIQIILSTQSQTMVNQVDSQEVIPVSVFQEVSASLTKEKEPLMHIKNWDLAQAVIGGKVIYIDEKNLDVWEAFDLAAGTNTFEGIHTVPVYMANQVEEKTMFYMKALLTEFLGRDVDICYVKGVSGMMNYQREELKAYANQRGVLLHLLERYEIENYLLNGELILRTLGIKYPQVKKPALDNLEEKIVLFLKATMNQADLGADATWEDYMQYGSGKGVFVLLNEWLINDWKMELYVEDVLKILQYQDVPEEILKVLKQIRSNCYTYENTESVSYTGIEVDEKVVKKEKSSQEDDVIQLTLPF